MGGVVVAGSANLDLVVFADRLPAPGETLRASGFEIFEGGKGLNQAIAAARAGAAVRFAGAVGDDGFGERLRAALTTAGVDVSALRRVAGTPTGTALITVAGGENTIVVHAGANAAADVSGAPLSQDDIALAQFEIPRAEVRAFYAAARTAGARTVCNPSPVEPIDDELRTLIDVLIVNETEAAALGGVESVRRDVPVVVLTLGARGVVAYTDAGEIRLPGHDVVALDPTGAGDCFAGALCARLADGDALRVALSYANAAAALSVTRAGAAASIPARADVDAFRAL